MSKAPPVGFCRSPDPLDQLTAALYRASCRYPPPLRIAGPRERSFIVVEQPLTPPGSSGGYCSYLVAKRGLPSTAAAAMLARLLGAPWASVAGLKDTEATTVQEVCLPCPPNPPMRLAVRGRLWARLLGRRGRCPRRGELRGNCFTVVMEAPGPREAAEAAETLRQLAAQPLPAYYGYQRFGTRRPNTHIVGLLLIRGDYEQLIYELLASGYPDESPDAKACRRARWSPPECRRSRLYEAAIAERLKTTPMGPRSLLPRTVAELAAGAVQAYIYNYYLSLRIERGHPLTVRLTGERLAVNGTPMAPVPGVGKRVGAGGEARKLLLEAIEMVGLTVEQLSNPAPGSPRLRGYWRPVAMTVQGLKVAVEDDRLVLRFCLEKGMYATTLLREVASPF